jgi:hypothetical protein
MAFFVGRELHLRLLFILFVGACAKRLQTC